MIVVSDSGPIHYLVLIEAIDILPVLFGRVAIPPRVVLELTHPKAPPSVSAFLSHRPEWLAVAPAPPRLERTERLDAGEREAIALSHALVADLLLMDDRKGVVAARARGIKTIGTVGVLELGARKGLVDIVDAVERLSATNFRMTSNVVATIRFPPS